MAIDAFGCTDSASFFPGVLTGKITEVEDGPDTVSFACYEEGPSLGWTKLTTQISGSLTLADRP